MKIASCALNPTVGDLGGNVRRVLDALQEAASVGAELAVLPELVVPGYPPLDLLERPSFVQACLEAESEIIASMPEGLTAVFGNVRRRPDALTTGRPIQNAAVVARRGQRITGVAKTLLPTYDVFDEARYFEPRREEAPAIFEQSGLRIGVTICEDMWNDEEAWAISDLWREDSAHRLHVYERDPVREVREAGAELILNLSASPWSRGKLDIREELVAHAARRHGVPIVYVNAVGGNDGLVFDGRSLVATPERGLVHRGVGWQAKVDIIDLGEPSELAPVGQPIEEIREALCLGIRDYFRKTGIQRAVIGLSGGIDSAVTCALAVRALGPERVTGVAMPSAISSEHSVEDAEALARNLGIDYQLVPIASAVDAFESMLAPMFAGLERDVTEENLQSRVRGTTLMAIANKKGGVVLGTGNKSEASMGYATLYGDTNGALSVLADLYKHQVYDLARLENEHGERIPTRTIDKPPSAELRPNQKDSDSLPDYAILDAILEAFLERRLGLEAIAEEVGVELSLVEDIARKVYFNEFKRKQLPPTLRVCRKAWVGRIYPIAQGFRR